MTGVQTCALPIFSSSPQWKTIDHLYPHFGDELRNLRLGLASDGMNPFGIKHKPQFMACFVDDLLPPSLVVHQVKIHYPMYDDSGSKVAWE